MINDMIKEMPNLGLVRDNLMVATMLHRLSAEYEASKDLELRAKYRVAAEILTDAIESKFRLWLEVKFLLKLLEKTEWEG